MSASGPICHHTKTNGEPCGSPTLRGEQFCYYHHPTRRRPRAAGRKPRLPAFHLPTLVDRASLQSALAKVVSRVISGRLDRPTARLIVYALQGASECLPGDRRQLGALSNTPRLHSAARHSTPSPTSSAPSGRLARRTRKCTKSKANHLRNIT